MKHQWVKVLEEIIAVHKQYGNEEAVQKNTALLEEMQNFRVRVPVIGKFSAGKSTLINTLLGYANPLLAEDILPETAIPTELCYGEQAQIFLCLKDGTQQELTAQQFRAQQWDTEKTQKVRLTLPHAGFAEVPQVDLVDMPGFGSGYEAHNRVLDEYLPGSSAYILVFSIEDAVLKGDMAAILKELELRRPGQPMCAVLMRAARKTEAEQDEVRAHLTESFAKYIDRELSIYLADPEMPECKTEIWGFLQMLQQNREELMKKEYFTRVQSEVENIYLYLEGRLRDIGVDEETRRIQRERVQKEMTRLERETEKQLAELHAYVPVCRDSILQEVMRKLQSRKAGYVQQIMSRRSVEDAINKDVRAAVIQGVSKQFDTKLRTYLERIETNIKTTVAGLSIGAMETKALGDSAFTGGLAGAAAVGVGTWAVSSGVAASVLGSFSLTAGILTALGSSVLTVAVPVVGVAVAAVVGLVQYSSKKKEMQQQVEQNLQTDVFPQVLRQLEQPLGKALSDAAQQAARAIDNEIKSKRSALEQSIGARKSEDTAAVEAERIQIQTHMDKLKELCDA